MKYNFAVYLHIWYLNDIMDQEQLNAAVNDLVLSVGLLVRRIRAESISKDLSWTERAVMARLAVDGPTSISDLARAESMKPQSMGAIIASLQKLEIVERTAHPTDGRQVQITLTAKGAALREQNRAAKRTWLAQTITQLDEPDQQTLFRAGEIIKRLVETNPQ